MGSLLGEVAKLAGVSNATASRVFTGHPNIRDEVRDRVLKAAAELGYAPKRGSRKKIAGLILPSYGRIQLSSYFGMAIEAISAEAFERGWALSIVPMNNMELLKAGPAQGAISLMVENGIEVDWSAQFNIPLIAVNTNENPQGGVWQVCSDEAHGMELGVENLCRNGHRKIGIFITGDPDNLCNVKRREGYLSAMKKRGLQVEAGSRISFSRTSMRTLVISCFPASLP